MMGIGFPELMVILVIIMIIFGAGKLPEIGNAFGRSIKNFKTSMKEAEEESGDQVAQAEGGEAASNELPNPESTPTAEEEVTAQLGGSHPKAASSSQSTAQSTATPASSTSKPAPATTGCAGKDRSRQTQSQGGSTQERGRKNDRRRHQ